MAMLAQLQKLLRRVGLLEAQTVANAQARLERVLQGKRVLSRERRALEVTQDESAAFVATVAPFEQRFTQLSEEELAAIRDNAKLVRPFMTFHGVQPAEDWSLEDLDAAFSAWTESGCQVPYDNEFVIEVTGAAFGEYCAKHLGMEWVLVEDEDGKDVALRGREVQSQSFPFASVAKRVSVREHGFFKPVFLLIQDQAKVSAPHAV